MLFLQLANPTPPKRIIPDILSSGSFGCAVGKLVFSDVCEERGFDFCEGIQGACAVVISVGWRSADEGGK